MPGNKVQVAVEVAGVIQLIQRATQERALIGTTPIQTVLGTIQAQEAHGVILLLAIHPLEVPAVAAVSRAVEVADSAVVVAVVTVVVADMEDGKIIRSPFYSI
jgi:hypothetical protein